MAAEPKIGVVARCLKMPDPAATAAAARRIGADWLQVSNERPGGLSPASRSALADAWRQAARSAGLRIASIVTGFAQEDYSSIAAIHRTGGLVPDDLAEANLLVVEDAIRLAGDLGADLLTFHAGFIPEQLADPVFAKLLDRLGRAADLAGRLGVRIGLESGQESAATLRAFLSALGRANVGINFDPANMILYGRQEPLDAVDVLADRIFQVHAKDGAWSDKPGVEWGRETPLGQGQVDFVRLLGKLRAAGFVGCLIIEREAGSNPLADIADAVKFLRKLCVAADRPETSV